MKITKFAFMALATAFAATSCQSDEELLQKELPSGPINGPMVINAATEGIGTGTRATMAYKYDILWSTNDQIYVKNSTNNATFTLKTGQGTTNGTFECNSSPFSSGEEVEAFYPESLIKGDSLVWPAEQTTSTVIPMYSKQTLGGTGTENFSFASLGAILQIVFNSKQENVTLKSITIKDDTNPLSGTFTVNEDGKAVMTANADATGITYDLGEKGKALGNGANYFNIAVPAGEYSNLSITFTTIGNSTCTLMGSLTLNHNTVGRLTLTGKEFKSPYRGTASRYGGVYVNWVQLWENGPKFAEYNVGAESATDYGGYYAWGGSQNKSDDHNTGSANLSGTDDTATKLWGDNWCMPTYDDFGNLCNFCDMAWTYNYKNSGKKGIIFTGQGVYIENSVFFPAGGISNKPSSPEGWYGFYWSSTFLQSTPQSGTYAYSLECELGGAHYYGNSVGDFCSVRAVLKEEK